MSFQFSIAASFGVETSSIHALSAFKVPRTGAGLACRQVGTNLLIILQSAVAEVEPNGQRLSVELDSDVTARACRIQNILGIIEGRGIGL